MDIKSRRIKGAGFLAAAITTAVTAGILQPAVAQPVYAAEGLSEVGAVSYIDMYGSKLDELAEIDDAAFMEGNDYTKYALYDMTGDGIKELLVHHYGNSKEESGYFVYTWDGTQVVCYSDIIYRDGELRGNGISVLNYHDAPARWSNVVNVWNIVDNSPRIVDVNIASMDDTAFPDYLPDWANAVPIEFSADMYDRSILEKESGGETIAQPDEGIMAEPAEAPENERTDAPTGIQESKELEQMVNMVYRLYDHRVSIADSPDLHLDLASLSGEDKVRLLDYYQNRFAKQDDRIQWAAGIMEYNIATKETLSVIMTELFGSVDEDTMNAVFASYWINRIDGDYCYMNTIGFGTMASNYIFGQYETAGYDENGQIVLTGKVYDWSAPDYNNETQMNATPRGTYRIVLTPEGGPAVFGGCRFKEMTVTGE